MWSITESAITQEKARRLNMPSQGPTYRPVSEVFLLRPEPTFGSNLIVAILFVCLFVCIFSQSVTFNYINPVKAKSNLNYIERFSSYRAVKHRLSYKNQSVL